MSDTATPTIDDLLVHAAFIRGLARATVRGDDLVDDTVQQTWLEALERGPSHGASPRGWLSRVTRHAGYAILRKRERSARHEAAASERRDRASVPSTAAIVAKEEMRRKLVEVLLRLDEPYRSAVLLRYYEDLPPREVAARLEIPVETARTRIKRGLHKLRGMLDAQTDGDRRKWVTALVPLAELGSHASHVATAGAAKLALGKLLVPAAALLLVVGGTLWWQGRDGTDAPNGGVDADAGRPALMGRAPAVVRGTAAGALRGRVGGEVAAGARHVEARWRLPAVPAGYERLASLLAWSPGEGLVLARSPVADDGTFHLEGLGTGTYELTLLVDGVPTAAGVGMIPVEGLHGPCALDDPGPGLTLRGRARHPDGTPFRGWVFAVAEDRSPTAWPFSPRGPLPVHTDADGAFVLHRVPRGAGQICALVPRRMIERFPVDAFETTSPDLVVGNAPALAEVRVVDPDGRALPDAIAYCRRRGDDGTWQFSRVGADDTGRLRVPSDARLTIGSPGLLWEDGVAVARIEGAEVRLQRARPVEGQVADAKGDPVEGASVHVSPPPRAWKSQAVTSDRSGRFSIAGLPAREYTIYVHGNGWVSEALTQPRRGSYNPLAVVVDAEGEPSTEFELDVIPAGRIRGRVLDTEGTPLPGIYVTVTPADEERRLHGRTQRHATQAVATDAKGWFTLDTVLPGVPTVVSARAWDGRGALSESLTVQSGASVEVSLVLAAPYRFVVEVRDDKGAPAEGVAVSARQRETPDRGWMGLGTSGRSGRVERTLPAFFDIAQPLELRLSSDRHLDRTLMLELPESGETTSLVIDIGESIEGRVLLPDGWSTKDAKVRTWPKSNAQPGRSRSTAGLDEDGYFEVRGLQAGPHALEVVAEGGGSSVHKRIEVAAGDQGVEITVRPAKPSRTAQPKTYAWTLRVRGADGTTPRKFETAHYEKRYAHRPAFPGGGSNPIEGREGTCTRQRLSPGSRAWFSIYGAEGLGAVLVGPFDVNRDGETIDVTLPAPLAISGRLLDPEGKGLRGVVVKASPVHETFEKLSVEMHGQTRTGADGRFTLQGLGDMAYTLQVKLPKAMGVVEPVRARAGVEDVVVRVRRAADVEPLVVTVLDPSGAPVTGATLQGRTLSARPADAEGRIVLLRVPSKPEGVFVLPPTDRGDLRQMHVPAWTPASTTIRLPAGGSISGRAEGDLSDAKLRGHDPRRFVLIHVFAVSGAWAESERGPEMGNVGNAKVGPDGRFELRHLPPGEYDLVAWMPFAQMGRLEEVARVRARTGDRDVVVPFERGLDLRVRIEGWQPGARQPRAILTRPSAKRFAAQRAPIADDGTLTLVDLRKDERYRLIVSHSELNRCVNVEDVRWSNEELVVRLVPAKSIRGRLLLPGGAVPTASSVYAHNPASYMNVHARVNDDLTFEIRGLPDGVWEMHANAHTPDVYYAQKVKVRAGEAVTIQLEASDELIRDR